jgi:hypothetical protein
VFEFIRNLFATPRERGFAFSRPLVVLQSDDWGRVGVRDREGFEALRAAGLRLGEHPYDLYTLETADDVSALTLALLRHRDSIGRTPCMALNVCAGNVDFTRMQKDGYRQLRMLPLSKGLPGQWSRPGLFESYRAGIEAGIFHPGMHGATHFSRWAVEKALAKIPERAALLKTLWKAETPYIFWRMPWIGYEYWSPEASNQGFLGAEQQRRLTRQACQTFSELFGRRPVTACAPGTRANRDTHRVWAEAGIRVTENGTGDGLRPPRMDEFGLLHLYRSIDFEPHHREVEIEKYMEIAGVCFARGLPMVVSVHSINFHSSLKDFRSGCVAKLDQLLTALEWKYPDLLYVSDEDLYRIVTEGVFDSRESRVAVSVRQQDWNPRLVQQGAL